MTRKYKQTVLERINMLQNQIVIHSIIYYEYNDNIWTDGQFDDACKQLVNLMSTKEWKQSEYHKQFQGFDGSTGCHIARTFLGSKGHVAQRLLKRHKTTC